MITFVFLRQLTSSALYKKLREILILPSITCLWQYSAGMSINTCHLNTSYLSVRRNNLLDHCRTVVLMIDKIYTAKRVKYSKVSFVRLAEEGLPSETVMTFMTQSVNFKYKNVVCLQPVYQLDKEFLKSWFYKVMVALHDLFFVVAVPVDNHACNRYVTG